MTISNIRQQRQILKIAVINMMGIIVNLHDILWA